MSSGFAHRAAAFSTQVECCSSCTPTGRKDDDVSHPFFLRGGCAFPFPPARSCTAMLQLGSSTTSCCVAKQGDVSKRARKIIIPCRALRGKRPLCSRPDQPCNARHHRIAVSNQSKAQMPNSCSLDQVCVLVGSTFGSSVTRDND